MDDLTTRFEDVKRAIRAIKTENAELKRQIEQAEKAIVELRADRDYLRTLVDSVGGRG